MIKPLIILLFLIMTEEVFALEIVPNGNMETPLMEVRLRSFNNTGGEEIYLGIPSVGNASNRVATNHFWTDENWLEINYSYASDELEITVYDGPRAELSTSVITSLLYPNWEFNMQSIIGSEFSARDLNALNLIIYNREVNGELSIENVELNNVALGGGFNLPPGSVIPSVDNWLLKGECFADFNFYGNVVRSQSFSNSQELGKIEFRLGTVAVSNSLDSIFSNGFDFCR